VELYLHSPYVFMARCLGKHRDNFTFTFLPLVIRMDRNALFCRTIKCDYIVSDGLLSMVYVLVVYTTGVISNLLIASIIH
jgi:hypothetical protein